MLSYDLLLALIPTVIVAAIWRSVKTKNRPDKPRRKSKTPPPGQNNPYSPSTDFAALINAIIAEGRAYRDEEQREDRSKKFREWLTIVLIGLTFIAIALQVNEMIKVYGPIADQAEAAKRSAQAAIKQSKSSERALIQAQRAWVGPLAGKIMSEPAIGKPIEVTVTYQNSGREPAMAVIYSAEPFGAKTSDQTSAAAKISEYMEACRATKEWKGGSVVYPSSPSGFGEGGYTLWIKSKDDFVTDAMIKGDEAIIIQGCFSYRTFDIPKHSYFCYFYLHGVSKVPSLNICTEGHDAD